MDVNLNIIVKNVILVSMEISNIDVENVAVNHTASIQKLNHCVRSVEGLVYANILNVKKIV
jgi:hypothetical protein